MLVPPGRIPPQTIRLIGLALLAGSLAFLGLVVFLRGQNPPSGPEVIAHGAIAFAVLAAVAGPALRAALPAPARLLVPLAVCESGVLACAVALLVSPPIAPLYAAAVPAAMLLKLALEDVA
jgi:hypothetical protein